MGVAERVRGHNQFLTAQGCFTAQDVVAFYTVLAMFKGVSGVFTMQKRGKTPSNSAGTV